MIINSEEKSDHVNNERLNAYSLAGIGIGGVIGAGFFLGSSLAINQAGPSVIIAFLLGGMIMSQVLGAMTSITINRTSPRSFRVYIEEFLGPFPGALIGWMVLVSGILTLCSEALASGTFLRYWFPNLSISVLALLVLFFVIGINALGKSGFGSIETAMAMIKIAVLLIFIVLGGLFLFMRGIPLTPNPFSSFNTVFPKGVSGLFQSMLIVIFTYGGISAVAMAAPEVKEPRKEIPKATVLTTLGVVFLYVISMAVIVSLVRWNTINTDVSPFVLAFSKMRISWASAMMNLIILVTAVSVMIATYYTCSRMLVSLSKTDQAPALFTNATPKGFYKNAWILVAISTFLILGMSFILGSKLFNYLVSASSYFSFLNWSINLITFIVWLKHRNDEENYVSPLIWGRFGAYGTLGAIVLLSVVSLRVEDFRIGFYIAIIILIMFTSLYFLLKNKKKLLI